MHQHTVMASLETMNCTDTGTASLRKSLSQPWENVCICWKRSYIQRLDFDSKLLGDTFIFESFVCVGHTNCFKHPQKFKFKRTVPHNSIKCYQLSRCGHCFIGWFKFWGITRLSVWWPHLAEIEYLSMNICLNPIPFKSLRDPAVAVGRQIRFFCMCNCVYF